MRLAIGIIFLLLSSLSTLINAEPSDGNDPLHMDWMDTSILPGDSFYRYANGTWQKQNPIPPQYASWGTFEVLHEKVQKIIHQMLIDASENKSAAVNSDEQKVGDFYYSGMNEALVNKLGATPLQPEFDRIAAISNLNDLQAEIAHLHYIGVDACFDFNNMQDFKNSEEMIGDASQGGLGLPDRDYYFKDDKKFQQIREAYVRHIGKVFELLGDKPDIAKEEANVVMKMETNMAKASMTRVAQRDPHAIYHIKNLVELKQLTPDFSWPAYFAAIGYPAIDHINIGMPHFFKNMNTLLQSISLNEWKIYLRWHLIDTFSSFLSQPFVEENFHMNSEITGAKKLLPRWQRVVKIENSALGFAIGKMYVKKYFPPSSKKAVLEILSNIRKTLRSDLQTLSWMTPATREAAIKKLDSIGERVGYPSKWWDYSSLVIDRGPYVLNVMRSQQFVKKHALDKIGKPIDRTEWEMTPQTVNAYYDASMNNINMPAGILQPPFFDPTAPIAVNYGGIGFVMGHEITHGFDDQGSQFDGHGNLRNWWTPEDLKKFQEATHCIVTQFSQYKVDGDLSVQGELVVGEATADLGGVILAYRAFHESEAYKTAKTINGLTPDQQFFLGAAHSWATNMRPEQLRNLVTIDPHPPAQFRVDGTLANMPQFQSAFSIPEDSAMINKQRCVIW